jgi:hypothetical protein
MCLEILLFFSFPPNSDIRITFAGGHDHDVTRIGSIAICLPTRELQKISNIHYSTSIRKNLLSIIYLTDKGFRFNFFEKDVILRILRASILI